MPLPLDGFARKTRLIGALVLVTGSCLLIWWSEGFAAAVVGLPLLAAQWMVRPSEELSRRVNRKEVAFVVVLLGAMVLGILFSSPETPERHADHLKYQHMAGSPAILIPVWLLLCVCICSVWKRSFPAKAVDPLEKPSL